MKIKWLFFEFFFLDFQLNSSRHNFFNSKSIVQIFSIDGGQSHLKLQVSVQKNFFFELWMLISSYLYSQTSWNFYDMISKKCKVQDLMVIFLKNFFFLDERGKNGSFEWFLVEKWLWSFSGKGNWRSNIFRTSHQCFGN